MERLSIDTFPVLYMYGQERADRTPTDTHGGQESNGKGQSCGRLWEAGGQTWAG